MNLNCTRVATETTHVCLQGPYLIYLMLCPLFNAQKENRLYYIIIILHHHYYHWIMVSHYVNCQAETYLTILLLFCEFLYFSALPGGWHFWSPSFQPQILIAERKLGYDFIRIVLHVLTCSQANNRTISGKNRVAL